MERRKALKLTLVATCIPFVPACKNSTAVISGLNVIRVREKSNHDNAWTFLEVSTNNMISGYGGPLLGARGRNLEKNLPQLRKILIGRDPLPLELDFEWIWNQLYPDNRLSDFQKGIDLFN